MNASPESYSEAYGVMPDGRSVERHVMTNRRGASVSVIDYGAIVTSIVVPDGNGQLGEVTLGLDALTGYLRDTYFLGAVVGRYANRIAKGEFELLGKRYQLPLNNGANHLHGGPEGFFAALWKSHWFTSGEVPVLCMTLESPDGAAGYPGAMQVSVRYAFDDDCRLSVEYEAVTTAPTVINLTQHSYFNLAGRGTILDHELQIDAESFTPTDAGSIPTGELRAVNGTAFDFRRSMSIGSRIEAPDEQLRMAGGYDHNFVLDGEAGQHRQAARLRCAASGRQLVVRTTEPGMQFYSGNFLPKDHSVVRGATRFGYREGLCLETQHYPDSPNRPQFPSTRLDPGQRFQSTTLFEFSTFGPRISG
ncbi:MAG TPA: aldose epimerase family protein [Polyangiaceae bacterium]